jgi:hypothetical protein
MFNDTAMRQVTNLCLSKRLNCSHRIKNKVGDRALNSAIGTVLETVADELPLTWVRRSGLGQTQKNSD